jgi:serine/threonine protein kinase/formylglycine-generating enzyme required for sulfatase activity
MDDIETQRVPADVGDGATLFVVTPQVEFDRYELLKELGRGGAGFVWLAQDRVLGVQVALKTLREEMTSQPSALLELKREVLLNRTLSHPHIVKTYDFVTNGRSSAIAMEYVRGTNLQRLKGEQKQGFFEVEDIAKWMLQLCTAMEYAHRQRVVHRDLKPANLMVDAGGDLKVGDFGIGRAVAETAVGLTRNSSGTPPFMSPQQMMGEAAVPSDDIYSIGATVYDLLTGDPPFFRGAIREQAMAKVAPAMHDRRRELGRRGQNIPRAWETAVAACLAKESSGRPASVAKLREAFEGRPVLLTGTPPLAARGRKSNGGKWLLASAAIALLAGAVAGDRPWTRPWFQSLTATVTGALRPTIAPVGPTEGVPAPVRPGATPGTAATLGAADHAADAPEVRAPAAERAALAAAGKRSPADDLVDAGKISADEAVLLKRSLAGLQGDFEQRLAQRLLLQRTLSDDEWRDYTGLVAPRTPVVGQLRPLYEAGMIKETEFAWLAAALSGAKGDAELALADRFVEARELTPAQWRAQTLLYPPPPVDPIVEKVKPLFSAGLISVSERSWLEAALAGKKGDTEKQAAESLLDAKTVTVGQWRAHTALPYPPTADALADPAHWPPAIDLRLSATAKIRLLRLDPGTFLRGTPLGELGRRNNEPIPEQTSIAQPFYLGVYDVTQAEYTAVMPRNPSYWRGHANWPVDQVDWQSLTGADGFLERLNRILSRQWGGALRADLPTNDEWEYACRAGTQSSFYEGGPISTLERDPVLDQIANYNRPETGSPQPVGSYAPNAWGFYDMLGNVSQWCRDRYVRGGSWQSNAAGCRIGWRTQFNSDSDTDQSPNVGFRLALRRGN